MRTWKTKIKKSPLDYAFRILSMRDYSESSMKEKLTQRYSREEAEEALSRLVELGYINDSRYAENFSVSQLLSGFGPYVIVRKLREKGIFRDVSFVEQAAHERDIDIEELFLGVLKKYVEKRRDQDRMSLRSKSFAFVMRRGFDISLAEKYLERVLNESDIS
jgi:regulatory protein